MQPGFDPATTTSNVLAARISQIWPYTRNGPALLPACRMLCIRLSAMGRPTSDPRFADSDAIQIDNL